MKKLFILLIGLIPLVVAGGIVVFSLQAKNGTSSTSPLDRVANVVKDAGGSPAEQAGRDLSGGKCSGTGPGVLTRSPMDPEDFSIIIPYGLMVGGHVTPIDHQYFAPKDYKSARDSYEVYAMADSRVVDLTERTNERGTEYRFVFAMTCTSLYYYDLVTSLAPDIKVAYDKDKRDIDIEVKAGQLVGKIGGQTLDFAIWDTTKPLKGFIVPEHYNGERWKLYTADPLDYYAPDLKELALSRYIRTAEPNSGKIDYDIDGKLIGNWFLEGTGGYDGNQRGGAEGYWRGHLAIVPEHIDPTATVVSFGDYGGKEQQFIVRGEYANPADVSMATGLVKYELAQWSYVLPNGQNWDRNSVAKDIKVKPQTAVQACVLFQLLEDRKLKMESFSGKSCANIAEFTSAAKAYGR